MSIFALEISKSGQIRCTTEPAFQKYINTYIWERLDDPSAMQASFLECMATGEPATVETVCEEGRFRTTFQRKIGKNDKVNGVLGVSRKLDDMPNLTPRESEVLHLTLEGKTTAQIARRFGCTTSTVSTHKSNLYRKFGDRNLTLAAVRCGLIDV